MVGIITSNECRIQTVEGHETRGVFERIQSGDEDAAREVFDRYLTRLVALARSRLSEKLARKVDADLIVMASHKPSFSDILLQPNASQVLHHAPISVLIVR